MLSLRTLLTMLSTSEKTVGRSNEVKGSQVHRLQILIAVDLGNTARYNAAAEFWPDFHPEVPSHILKCGHSEREFGRAGN